MTWKILVSYLCQLKPDLKLRLTPSPPPPKQGAIFYDYVRAPTPICASTPVCALCGAYRHQGSCGSPRHRAYIGYRGGSPAFRRRGRPKKPRNSSPLSQPSPITAPPRIRSPSSRRLDNQDRIKSPARQAKRSPTRQTEPSRSPARQTDRTYSPARQRDRTNSPARQIDRTSSPARQADRTSSPARQTEDRLKSPVRSGVRSGLPVRTADTVTTGIPVRDGTRTPGRTTPRYSSPRNSVSKESTPSPAISPRNSLLVVSDSSSSRIPISVSQEDLLKCVQLRNSANKSNSGLSRPTSNRNSSSSPRNSKLVYSNRNSNSSESLSASPSLSRKKETITPSKVPSPNRPVIPPKPNSLSIQSPNKGAKVGLKSNSKIPAPSSSKLPIKQTSPSKIGSPSKTNKATAPGSPKLRPKNSPPSRVTPAKSLNCARSPKVKPKSKSGSPESPKSVRSGKTARQDISVTRHHKTTNRNADRTNEKSSPSRSTPSTANGSPSKTSPNGSPKTSEKSDKDMFGKEPAVKHQNISTPDTANKDDDQQNEDTTNPCDKSASNSHSSSPKSKNPQDNPKLAPRAKFRADDEISITEATDLNITCTDARADPIYESLDLLESKQASSCIPERPTRAKNCGPGAGKVLGVAAVAANAGVIRSSADVQCWPWGGPVATRQERGALKGNSLPVQVANNNDSSTAAAAIAQRILQSKAQEAKFKSVSLQNYYKSEPPRPKGLFGVRSTSHSFFQRLNNLRRSFSNDRSKSPPRITPHTTDNDSVFFRGFSGKRSADISPDELCHGPNLIVPPLSYPERPPRRKRPKRHHSVNAKTCETPLRRSLSFTDAQFIAQAVVEGDPKLIEELYPDFPRSTPIYAVIDRTKKTKRTSQNAESPRKLSPIPGSSSSDERRSDTVIEEDEMVKPGGGRSYGSTPTGRKGNKHKANREAHHNGETLDVTFNNSVVYVRPRENGRGGPVADLVSPPPPPSQLSDHSRLFQEASRTKQVTKVHVESCTDTPQRINFYQPREPSPIISPWSAPVRNSTDSPRNSGGSGTNSAGSPRHSTGSIESTGSSPITTGPDNVVLVECNGNSGSVWSVDPHPSSHPFLSRLQNNSSQSDLVVSTRGPGVFVTPSKLSPHSELSISSHWAKGANFERSDKSERERKLGNYSQQQASGPQSLQDQWNNQKNLNVCRSTEDQFKKILATADNNITQAESILSSLGCQGIEISNLNNADSEDDPASLGSDIETNIRRLEKTQAKINKALETFRNVQTFQSPDIRNVSTSDINRNQPPVSLLDCFSDSQYSSLPPNVEGRTEARPLRVSAPAHPNFQSEELARKPLNQQNSEDQSTSGSSGVASHNGGTSRTPKKPGLFRRHSFSLSNKEKSPAPSTESSSSSHRGSSLWYDGDVDSASESTRHSANYEDGSFSDSEGGFSPIKSRLRGLLGSFGKGKKKPGKTSPRKKSSLGPQNPNVDFNDQETSEFYTELPDNLSTRRLSVSSHDIHQAPMPPTSMGNALSSAEEAKPQQREHFSHVVGQYTELVKNLPANQLSGRLSPLRSNFKDQTDGATGPSGLRSNNNISPASTATESVTSRQSPAFMRPKPKIPEKPNPVICAQATIPPSQRSPQASPLSHTQCDTSSNSSQNSSRNPKISVTKNYSNDTFTSVASSSFNGNSNRNSVISGQSISSESFENDICDPLYQSDNDNGERTSNSSPQTSANDDLTPVQRHEKKVYYIAREIMTSEKSYVDVLRLINIEFREFVQRHRKDSKSGIMPDQDFVQLFSNLPELMMLNEDLLRDFEDRVENWDSLKKIADVLLKKGPYLKLYTVYIRDFSSMNYHFDDCCQRFPKFAKLVKEFEKSPRCQNLKLKHFMLKPVQRLPQYKLLLDDYLKHLDPESIDFDDTTQALTIVTDAAEHANNTVKQGDKFQQMLRLQSRLGDMELIKPGRELLKEGELQKISRKGVGPRYFILLSDCLLYTTYHGTWSGDSTSLKVSYNIMLNQLHVHVPQAEDFQTEFSITSNVRSCTLRASNVKERNDWLDALNSAIEEYRNKKATFVTVDQLNPLTRMEGNIGDSAPVWIPDQRVTMCQTCNTEFTIVNRRHHCRACGKVVCSNCSGNKAPLRYRQYESVRVCDSCYDAVEKQCGNNEDLRSRFKKRETSRNVARYIPQRLKVSANDEGSAMSGYLKKRQKNSKWKRCWFVLKDRVLYTYKASEDAVATDTLPVLGLELEPLSDKNFELYEGVCAGLVFQLTHPGRETLVFCAENDNVAEKWMASFREAITMDL